VKGVSVSGAIPKGGIEVVSDGNPGDMQLGMLKDDDLTVMFYYHFRAIGLRGSDCQFRNINAHESVAKRRAGGLLFATYLTASILNSSLYNFPLIITFTTGIL
jgi:hypothetical protein